MFTKFKHLTWKASLLAALISMLAFTIVLAASGDLDTTFSGDGMVTTNIVPSNPNRIDKARGVAVQSDGKIVVVGYSYLPTANVRELAVARYKVNGGLDTTFGGDGRLITKFNGVYRAGDVAIQPNGRIIVAGYLCTITGGDCDVALVRYKSTGALDTTFGENGRQITDFGGYDNFASAVAIQPDGKIVVAGDMWNGTDYDCLVYRYLSNGDLDPAFSGDGVTSFVFGPGRNDLSYDLAIQSDGKIVIVGGSREGEGDRDFAIARLNQNGTLDKTFSGDGKVTTNFGRDDVATGVALQANGKIVVVGGSDTPSKEYIAIARYNSNGSLDTTFSGDGKNTFQVTPGKDNGASDVIVQLDGKIVIAGSVEYDTYIWDFALLRLKPGGGLDTTFSGDGKVIIDFGGNDGGASLALQGGKYVIAGTTDKAGQDDFALARVLP